MTKFLALYLGTPDNQPAAPPNEETIAKGMAAWGNWMAQHASQVVDSGGPLGKTKKASKAGVSDTRNNVAGYIVIEAESHAAAAKLFEGHPHFAIFPGDSVEVMEVLPIPGG
jgi:YCII-related domain